MVINQLVNISVEKGNKNEQSNQCNSNETKKILISSKLQVNDSVEVKKILISPRDKSEKADNKIDQSICKKELLSPRDKPITKETTNIKKELISPREKRTDIGIKEIKKILLKEKIEETGIKFISPRDKSDSKEIGLIGLVGLLGNKKELISPRLENIEKSEKSESKEVKKCIPILKESKDNINKEKKKEVLTIIDSIEKKVDKYEKLKVRESVEKKKEVIPLQVALANQDKQDKKLVLKDKENKEKEVRDKENKNKNIKKEVNTKKVAKLTVKDANATLLEDIQKKIIQSSIPRKPESLNKKIANNKKISQIVKESVSNLIEKKKQIKSEKNIYIKLPQKRNSSKELIELSNRKSDNHEFEQDKPELKIEIKPEKPKTVPIKYLQNNYFSKEIKDIQSLNETNEVVTETKCEITTQFNKQQIIENIKRPKNHFNEINKSTNYVTTSSSNEYLKQNNCLPLKKVNFLLNFFSSFLIRIIDLLPKVNLFH